MSRPSRKRSAQNNRPTPDEIRLHIEQLLDAQQVEWHYQLVSTPEPDWSHLLCRHLQMVELERLEAGLEEFFL